MFRMSMPRCEMCGWYFSDNPEKTHCSECKMFIGKIDSRIVKNELTQYLETLGLRKFHDTTVPEILSEITANSDKSINSELAVSVLHHYLLNQEIEYNVYDLFQSMTFKERPLIFYISINYRISYFRFLMNQHISGVEFHKYCKELIQSINDQNNLDETIFDQTVEVVEEVRKRIYEHIEHLNDYVDILTYLMSLGNDYYYQFIFSHLFTHPNSKLELHNQINLLGSIFKNNKYQDFNDIIVSHIIESINGSVQSINVQDFYPYRIMVSDAVRVISEELLDGEIDIRLKKYLILLISNFGNEPNETLLYEHFRKHPNEITYMDCLISLNVDKYVNLIIGRHLTSKNTKLRRNLQTLFSKRNRYEIISYLQKCIIEYVKDNHIHLRYLIEYYVGICNINHELSEINFLDDIKDVTNNERIIKLVSKSKQYIDNYHYSPQDFLMEKDEGSSGFGSVFNKWRG